MEVDTIFVENGGRPFEITPQVTMYDGGECWRVEMAVSRELAKGHLREIWRQFAYPASWGGAGRAYRNEPFIKREGRDFRFVQTGGLDI